MMNKATPVFIYTLTFLLAACSLIYELLLAKTASFFYANTVICYSLTIGVYLLAMGLGAWLGKRQTGEKAWRALFRVEMGLSVIGGLSVMGVFMIYILAIYAWYQEFQGAFFLFVGGYFFFVIAVGVLTGRELPLLLHIGHDISRKKSLTNTILAADYFGSFVAGLVFPLVLIPYFHLITISFSVAFLNLMIASIIGTVFLIKKRQGPGPLILTGLLCLAFIYGFMRVEALQQYFLKKYYYHMLSLRDLKGLFSSGKNLPDIQRYHSLYQQIDLVPVPVSEKSLTPPLLEAYTRKYRKDPAYPKNWRLFINGDFQWSARYEDIYHEYFAHIPVILQARVPRKVLILGGGDGLLLRELLKYPRIQQVTQVELDPKMLDLARTHPVLRIMNHNALDDPRVKVVVADAYHFMKHNTEEYDAIYIDFPDANDYHLSKLYSREFYHFIYKALNPEGYAVLDATGSALLTFYDPWGEQRMRPENTWEIYYHTLKAAGFKTIIPYVSNLEWDNQQAIDGVTRLLRDWGVGSNDKSRRQEARGVVRRYVYRLQESFIMVQRDQKELLREYRPLGIELNVLNRQRFHRAFAVAYSLPKHLDERKINTIARPVLPRVQTWGDLKRP